MIQSIMSTLALMSPGPTPRASVIVSSSVSSIQSFTIMADFTSLEKNS